MFRAAGGLAAGRRALENGRYDSGLPLAFADLSDQPIEPIFLRD